MQQSTLVVEGTDDEYRSLTVGRIILDAMKRQMINHKSQYFINK